MEESLIIQVQKNDILYNQKHPHYRDNKKKEIVWAKIAKKLDYQGKKYYNISRVYDVYNVSQKFSVLPKDCTRKQTSKRRNCVI